MSQHDPVTETQAIFTLPRYSGDNDDLGIQDIKCDVCNKVFTRSEHLRRHKLAHSAEKPFACVECKKQFARQDILRRHRVGHDLRRKGITSNGKGRYSRACFACASARVKCMRGNVCQRCRSRDLQCEYPSRRNSMRTTCQSTIEPEFLDSSGSTPDEGGHDGERMTERDDNDSCIISRSGKNGSNGQVLRSAPKESSWANHLLVENASDSASDGQPFNNSGLEVALDATGAVQTSLSGEPPISPGDEWLCGKLTSPNEVIIAGAELIPQVSEGNIGSLYNYSAINWLAPIGPTHMHQIFGIPSLQSTESSNVNAQGLFTSEPQERNTQPSPHLTTARYFGDSYVESYANLRDSGPTLDRCKPFLLGRIPSAASVGTQSESPMYYIDGDRARLSIPTRHKQQTCSCIPQFGGQSDSSVGSTIHTGSESIHTQLASEYTRAQILITEQSYAALVDNLNCISGRDISLSHNGTLPSLKELNEFATLYFDKFHKSFPLLHKASFLNNRDGCLLELAISAIGACYVGTFHARACSETLHELVHKLLEIAAASDHDPSEFPEVFGPRRSEYLQRLTIIQARILNVLGMFHSGNPKLARLAWDGRAILVSTCIDSKMLMSNHYAGWQAARDTKEDGERFLQQWLEGELKCRAGYFVWMLDCMMAYESDFRMSMGLFDGKAPLPCPEQIWDEPMLNVARLLILTSGPPSLYLALDILYTEQRIVPNLGELSRVLLIHGMYSRVWEVARYHSGHLSDWVPTALSEHHHRTIPEGIIKLSSTPVVSRWINGSCDCLDILHWSAQSTILQASGLEHPTVLHLHLARLILLAPVSDLQELAKAKVHQKTPSQAESYLYTNMQEHGLRNSLLKWVLHNHYKARLAIIHAGSIFWYLRRYSCGAVVEPFANYLATLVIWAYSVSTSAAKLQANPPPDTMTYESQAQDGVKVSQSSETSRHSQDDVMQSQVPTLEDHSVPDYYHPSPLQTQISDAMEQLESHGTSLIQLDRPCDDELVQLFVRFGEQMTPYMARIGNIKHRDSAGKILREGIKLLSCHDNKVTGLRRDGSKAFVNCTWGVAETFTSILSALGAVPEQNAIPA